MSEAFLGEISIFAGSFAPKDWALCNGQLLLISQNTALFSLLGTTYGGNGQSTFALPNLVDTAPMQAGQGPGLTNRDLGEQVGSQFAAVLVEQMPSHIHLPMGNATEDSAGLSATTGHLWGAVGPYADASLYAAATNLVAMNQKALGVTGGSQPHNNMQPYLGLNFIICLSGIFPARP